MHTASRASLILCAGSSLHCAKDARVVFSKDWVEHYWTSCLQRDPNDRSHQGPSVHVAQEGGAGLPPMRAALIIGDMVAASRGMYAGFAGRAPSANGITDGLLGTSQLRLGRHAISCKDVAGGHWIQASIEG